MKKWIAITALGAVLSMGSVACKKAETTTETDPNGAFFDNTLSTDYNTGLNTSTYGTTTDAFGNIINNGSTLGTTGYNQYGTDLYGNSTLNPYGTSSLNPYGTTGLNSYGTTGLNPYGTTGLNTLGSLGTGGIAGLPTQYQNGLGGVNYNSVLGLGGSTVPQYIQPSAAPLWGSLVGSILGNPSAGASIGTAIGNYQNQKQFIDILNDSRNNSLQYQQAQLNAYANYLNGQSNLGQ